MNISLPIASFCISMGLVQAQLEMCAHDLLTLTCRRPPFLNVGLASSKKLALIFVSDIISRREKYYV
jgi:hypothetical protein